MHDKTYDVSRSIYIQNVDGKGRGVFAGIDFKAGDIIESSPSWGFNQEDCNLIDRTKAFEYYFVRNDVSRDEHLMKGYFVFGFISIVNHSNRPNAKIVWVDRHSGSWADIVATGTILVNEEITHRYTNANSYKGIKDLID